MRTILLSALAFVCMSIQAAGDAAASLAEVKLFAFGGVGFVGTPSPGQKLFEQVMAGPEPLKQFSTILKEGTTEARLYALCGLWALDKAKFAEAAKSMKADKLASAQTAAGCIISLQTVSSIVQEIEQGRFDGYVSKKRAE
jgi:hypothetical protein